jgi:hypothetical protein
MLEYKVVTGFSCSIFRNGGVCILVKDNRLYQVLDLYNWSIEKIFEAWALTISINMMKLCILCLYRAPNKDLNQLIEQLDSTLLYLESRKLELLICGDTNINGTHQLLVYAVDMNLLGDNIDTLKKNAGTLIDTSKVVGPEVNTEKTKYMLLSRHQNAG